MFENYTVAVFKTRKFFLNSNILNWLMSWVEKFEMTEVMGRKRLCLYEMNNYDQCFVQNIPRNSDF